MIVVALGAALGGQSVRGDSDVPSRESAGPPASARVSQHVAALQGEQLISTGTAPPTMHDFLENVLTDVAAYWTTVWDASGRPEPTVNHAFPAAGESAPMACAPGSSDDATAGYCTLDDQIIISQQAATELTLGLWRANADPDTGKPSGDFSAAFAVAHEYAHNLQDELGLLPRADTGQLYPTYKTELQADCWAGVWAKSADNAGILEPGDIDEGVQTATLLGDYSTDSAQHHGTPKQRSDAFLMGYATGVESGCDPWLLGTY